MGGERVALAAGVMAMRFALTLMLVSAFACAHTSRPISYTRAVPPTLDSAETARWIQQEREACRGTFVTMFDEGSVAGSDGTYRHVARVSHVQCR